MSSRIKYPQLHNARTLKKLIHQYGTSTAIARELGCNRRTVITARRAMGMKKGLGAPVKYPILHNPAALKLLLTECGTYAGVARKVGCQIGTVWYAAAKLREEKRKE